MDKRQQTIAGRILLLAGERPLDQPSHPAIDAVHCPGFQLGGERVGRQRTEHAIPDVRPGCEDRTDRRLSLSLR